MTKMTKKDLIDHMANKCDMTKADSERTLNCILDCVRMTLKKGDELAIAGFGSFSTSQRKAREARNPRTGDVVKVPAMRVPKFKAGKALKELVR